MKIILTILLLIPALTFAEEKKLVKKCKQKPGTTYLECKMVEASNEDNSEDNHSSSNTKKTNPYDIAGVDKYDGRSELPYGSNPNYQTEKYFLNKYLNEWEQFYRFWSTDDYKHYVEKSDKPYEFEFALEKNPDVTNALENTAMLSYLLYENGKIIVDEITPKNRYGDLYTNDSKYHSQSVGKSITSYIVGHAICEGYIDSIDSALDDWPALDNTLYDGQKLIDLLNMNAGDQKYVKIDGIINSDRWYNRYPVQDYLQNEFRGSKKSNPTWNYNGFVTNLLGTYVLFKSDGEFQNLLDLVFQSKARIKDSVFFIKQENAKPEDKTFWNAFYANRYDYLRIARAMIVDWKNDTCVGKYLKDVYATAIPKNSQTAPGFRLSYTKKYAGQFHTHFKTTFKEIKRPIMMMDGRGGQIIVVDFEKDRVIAIQAIRDNFNFKKLVFDVISD